VIEDACQAIGAEYPGASGVKKAGAIGDAGCFSFFPSKNLGGFGDGGLVATRTAELAETLRTLRDHGQRPKYHHAAVGGNFRLDALQAAVLDVKRKYVDEWHAARRAHAARYSEAFRGTRIRAPEIAYDARGLRNPHIFNQYVVRVPERDRVKQSLQQAGIGCEVYYPVPLHLQECFRGLGYRAGDFPASEAAARETLALPVYPELTGEMQDAVIAAARAAVG
jgi:dTDP-4-amino-4,6-dideoxygalactose transaminase